MEWKKSYGGPESDYIKAWAEMSDGYLIGGSTYSGAGNDKSEPNYGDFDYWIIKIDKQGNKQWDKSFGGSGRDNLFSIVPIEGGFLLCGTSDSGISGNKSQVGRGENDYWVVKISNTGVKIWDKRFGGSENDDLSRAIETSDGGFILAGTSYSEISGDKTEALRSPNKIYGDFWLVKINANGTKIWDKSYGGAGTDGHGNDMLTSLAASNDGGFLLGGNSNSLNGFEKSEDSNGQFDFWLVKINSTGDRVWDKTFGVEEDERLTDVISSPDGGYVIAGVITKLEDPSEWTSFYKEILLRKVNSQGTTIWSTIYNPEPDYKGDIDVIDLAMDSEGFYLQYNNYEYPQAKYLAKYNWEGVNVYHIPLDMDRYERSSFLEINKTGEAFLGFWSELYELDYGLLKLKTELSNTMPELTLKLSRRENYHLLKENYEVLEMDALPFYISSQITKVEFYVDNAKIGEDNTAPYTYFWTEVEGNHEVKAIAYTSNDTFESKTLDWKVYLFYGAQAEASYNIISDAGTHSVKEEDYQTLNGGSSVSMWDVGDKVSFFLNVPDGEYIIKVRLRSGYHTPTHADPTSYWPDGYSFKVNNQLVTFQGDESTISEKDDSYGGSYWGTMVSAPTLIERSYRSLEIQTHKQWGGIDYIELVPLSRKIEAETNYYVENEAGSRPIGVESYPTLSNGSSAKIWDIGDKIRIRLWRAQGRYIIKARVRSGYYTSTFSSPKRFWPDGYTFSINVTSTKFTGDPSTISGKDMAYGGSYWGIMESDVIYLNTDDNLYVQANYEWLGVDYVELVPVESSGARLGVSEIVQIKRPEVYPNPFRNTVRIDLPETMNDKVSLTLYDSFGKIIIQELKVADNQVGLVLDLSSKNLPSGLYLLKLKTQSGEKTMRLTKE
ncbi:MAG TPA: T9SS type A sorting domain-containing protein [Cytophagales bacterium]|nr:T9SS type A sorting domain-containing protein [Cytophagales bacterium]